MYKQNIYKQTNTAKYVQTNEDTNVHTNIQTNAHVSTFLSVQIASLKLFLEVLSAVSGLSSGDLKSHDVTAKKLIIMNTSTLQEHIITRMVGSY